MIYTPETLGKFIRKRLLRDWDMVVAITGGTGVGKSTAAIQISRQMGVGFDFKKNVCFAPESKEIVEKFNGVPKLSPIIVDEAIQALFNMNFHDKLQQTLVKMYQMERHQNKCTFLLIPAFNQLAKSFKNEKVKLWIHVFSRGKAIMYIKDPRPKAEDVWHRKDSQKRMTKMKTTFSEQTMEELMAFERQDPCYYADFEFEDLEDDLKKTYKELKVESRKDLYKEEKEEKQSEKLTKCRLRLQRLVKWVSEKHDFTQSQIGEIIGSDKKYISDLMRWQSFTLSRRDATE